MAFHRGPKITTDGLVLYLDAANQKSYPGTGTTWNDLSGKGNDGTLINGPTFDSGNNGSIIFDGVDDYVDMGNFLYTNYKQHTAIVIFNSSNVNKVWGEILQKGQRRDFTIRQFGTTGRLDFRYATYDGTYAYIDFNLQNNTWYIVAMSIDTESGGKFKCYVNGEIVFQTDIVTPTTLFETQDTRYNGELRIGNHSSNSENLSGNVALVQMYDRTLTDQEILQNYNAIKSRYNL